MYPKYHECMSNTSSKKSPQHYTVQYYDYIGTTNWHEVLFHYCTVSYRSRESNEWSPL